MLHFADIRCEGREKNYIVRTSGAIGEKTYIVQTSEAMEENKLTLANIWCEGGE